MTKESDNGWFQTMVREKLEDHGNKLVSINKTVQNLRVDVARLKVQSGMWGAAAGAVPVAMLLIIEWAKG